MSITMTRANKKIVYIAGLSRVGSTMLDLVIGCNPKFIGLGEIFQVLRPDMNRFERDEYCSCGELTRDCSFWGVVKDRLHHEKTADLSERYVHTLQVFEELYGGDHILVDSSKLLDVLKTVRKLPGVDVKVIYLIRDVRAWAISRLNNRKKSPAYFQRNGYYVKKLAYQLGWKIHLIKWGLPFITRLPLYYFLLWYIQNKQIKYYLESNTIDYFCFGYDELGLNPDLIMKKVFDFLGEDIVNPDFCSENSESHVLVGNTKKSESDRRQGIFYDNRWMYRNEWVRSAALLPKIMRYNAAEVYKNIKGHSIWEK